MTKATLPIELKELGPKDSKESKEFLLSHFFKFLIPLISRLCKVALVPKWIPNGLPMRILFLLFGMVTIRIIVMISLISYCNSFSDILIRFERVFYLANTLYKYTLSSFNFSRLIGKYPLLVADLILFLIV